MSGLYRLLLTLPLLMLAACVHQAPRNPMAQWAPSENFDERRPRLIVLHATEMDSAEAALRVLKTENSGGQVSAHYLIAEDGRIFQLVSDSKRAWHAGVSQWQQRERCNDFSVGIELEGSDFEAFTEAQYASLQSLLAALQLSYPIQAIVGHSDIAPGRKTDPGPFFDWQRIITP